MVPGKPIVKSWREWITIFVCGICMGAADIVPGISGGQWLVMGIYSDLLNSIKSLNVISIRKLIRMQFRDFFSSVAWEFLSALLLGISFSFIVLVQTFDQILNHEIYRIYLYSGFFGLILASVIFCAKQLSCWNTKHFIALVIGALIAFFLSSNVSPSNTSEPLYDVYFPRELPFAKGPLQNYHEDTQMLIGVPKSTLEAMLAKSIISKETPVWSYEHKTKGATGDFVKGGLQNYINLWLVCSGAIAITALLLPGISGSYMLTILGAYSVAIGALADFVKGIKNWSFDGDAFFILLSLMIGIVLGGIIFPVLSAGF